MTGLHASGPSERGPRFLFLPRRTPAVTIHASTRGSVFVGLDRYQCDCTRTGYSGPNCTIREQSLQPLLLFPGLALQKTPLPTLVSGHGPLSLPTFDLSDTVPDLAPAQALTLDTSHSLLMGSVVSFTAQLWPYWPPTLVLSPDPRLLLALSCVHTPKVLWFTPDS